MPSRGTIQQWSDTYYAAMNARDADAVAALYATDAEVLDVVSGVVTCGRDAIRAVNAERFGGYSDYSLERLALVIDGDASSDRWVMRGTHDGEYEGLEPTGRRIEVTGLTFTTFGGVGLATSDTHYVNVAGLLQQLGLS